MDRRTQRCAQRRVFHANAVGLRSLCPGAIRHTLSGCCVVLGAWPHGQANARNTSASTSPARQLILEKVPLLVLSAASSVITLFAQRRAGVSTEFLPLSWRINNALVSYVAYIWQMICPVRLALVYPHPEDRLSFWAVAAAIAFLAGVTTVVLTFGKRHRYLI